MARHTVGKEKQKENNLFSGFSLADRGTQKRKEKRRIEKQKDNKIYYFLSVFLFLISSLFCVGNRHLLYFINGETVDNFPRIKRCRKLEVNGLANEI